MDYSQFHIGLDFWCGGKRWRCTDVGSRVIVAISLEPHGLVSLEVDLQNPSKRTEHRYVTDDTSWFNGPPYGIVEYVFDEDSILACSLERDDKHDDHGRAPDTKSQRGGAERVAPLQTPADRCHRLVSLFRGLADSASSAQGNA